MDNGTVGVLEDTIKDAKLVDGGLKILKKYEKNAPSFDPERRRFLKYCAVLVGSTILTSGCATIDSKFLSRDWKAYLLGQDLIRGPRLLRFKGRLMDAEAHEFSPSNQGFRAVDYDIPIGTPIVPTYSGRFDKIMDSDRSGGKELFIMHIFNNKRFRSQYTHLDSIIDRTKFNLLSLKDIIAFSGNSGYVDSSSQPEHLHFAIQEMNDVGPDLSNKDFRRFSPIPPGIDPFKCGIDGRRPVYWDTITLFPNKIFNNVYLQNVIDGLENKLKGIDIDKKTKQELLKRRQNPLELRDYLRKEVLIKPIDSNYKYPPDSALYALMMQIFTYTSNQEFIAMLPIPYPRLVDFYQKENKTILDNLNIRL